MNRFVQVVLPNFGVIASGIELKTENGRTYIKTNDGIETWYPSHHVEDDLTKRIELGEIWLKKNEHLKESKRYQANLKLLNELKERAL